MAMLPTNRNIHLELEAFYISSIERALQDYQNYWKFPVVITDLIPVPLHDNAVRKAELHSETS